MRLHTKLTDPFSFYIRSYTSLSIEILSSNSVFILNVIAFLLSRISYIFIFLFSFNFKIVSNYAIFALLFYYVY